MLNLARPADPLDRLMAKKHGNFLLAALSFLTVTLESYVFNSSTEGQRP